MPGTIDNLGSESLPSNLMEVKDSKAQGPYCEVGSEGSAEQMHELTYRNRIRGDLAEGELAIDNKARIHQVPRP